MTEFSSEPPGHFETETDRPLGDVRVTCLQEGCSIEHYSPDLADVGALSDTARTHALATGHKVGLIKNKQTMVTFLWKADETT